jgi:GMP synthase-like glutamine amidotransferase
MAEATLTLHFRDGFDGSPLDPAAIDLVTLDPPPLGALGPHAFAVEPGRAYRASVWPRRGLYRPAAIDLVAGEGAEAHAEIALPRRSTVLYVTIDAERDLGHGPNLVGLRAAAEASQMGLEVRQVWFGDLRHRAARDFDDDGTFLFFFAGSYTEWQEYGRNDDWRDLVDRLGALMRETDIPAVAVCGSHQLLASAFAESWHAVAHMTPAGRAPAPIADELASRPPRDLIPAPRLGEMGTFPFRPTAEGAADPLLLGLSGRTLLFTESHCDEVVDEARSPEFVALLEPEPAQAALALAPIAPHDRCRVQALRYVGPRHRLLYSCQFHPELVIHPSFAGAQRAQAERLGTDGMQLLINLFEAARAFWEALPQPGA